MLRKKERKVTDLYFRDYPNCESERLSLIPVKPDRPVKQDQLKMIATLSPRINFNCAEAFVSSGLFSFWFNGEPAESQQQIISGVINL